LYWGLPYVSSHKIRGVMTSCSTSIFDRNLKFLGVVGISVQMNVFISLLEGLIKKTPWAKTAFILNKGGKIIAETKKPYPTFRESKLVHPPVQLRNYSNGELLSRFQKDESIGYMVHKRNGKKILLFFCRLHVSDWYYVLEADYSMPNLNSSKN